MNKTTHLILLTVTTEKDVPKLTELIAQRAWSIDGVHQKQLDARLLKSFPTDSVPEETPITVTLLIDDDGGAKYLPEEPEMTSEQAQAHFDVEKMFLP